MQKVTVGKLDGKTLVFTQLESPEEVKQANVPNGVHFFWEYEGKRIYTPGEIVSMVIEHSQAGTLETSDFVHTQNIQTYYKNLYNAQRDSIVNHVEKMRKDIEAMNHIPDAAKEAAIKNLRKTEDFYKNNTPFPNVNGLFQPTQEQAEILLGGKDKVDKYLTKEQQAKLFKK